MGGDAGTFMFVTFQRGWGGGGVEPGVFLDLRKKKKKHPAAAPRGAIVGPKVRDYAARQVGD